MKAIPCYLCGGKILDKHFNNNKHVFNISAPDSRSILIYASSASMQHNLRWKMHQRRHSPDVTGSAGASKIPGILLFLSSDVAGIGRV